VIEDAAFAIDRIFPAADPGQPERWRCVTDWVFVPVGATGFEPVTPRL
jgi:hypothetical protein